MWLFGTPGSSVHGILQAVWPMYTMDFSRPYVPRGRGKIIFRSLVGKNMKNICCPQYPEKNRVFLMRASGKRGDKGWDGWMASLTQWTWVWVNSGRWWRTGKPGMLQSIRSQRVRHDWVTELNWLTTLLSNPQSTFKVYQFWGEKNPLYENYKLLYRIHFKRTHYL